MWNTRWPAGKINKPRFPGTLKLNHKEIFLPALLNVFNCIISLLILSYPIAFFIAFSKKIARKSFSFKEQCLEQTVSWLNVFSIIQNWPPKHFNMLFFSSNPGPKFTPSSNRLDTSEKLIITSSVTKDVYIRPCISLIRHHMPIYKS